MNFVLLLPEIYFFCSLLIFLTYTSILNLSPYYKFPNLFKNNLILLIFILLNVLFLVLNNLNIDSFTISNFFEKNTFTSIVQLLTISFSIIILIVGYPYIINNKINNFELLILFSISIFSLFLLVISVHMTTVYLLLELQGIAFYILTSFNRRNPYSLESGLKYFILGSFSSILLLFGISIIYGFTGLLSFNDINLFLKNIDLYNSNFNFNLISIGFVFILISFLFKFYAAPFHLWISDIYQGAPTVITAFFAVVPFISIFYLFNKILLVVFFKLYVIYNPIIMITIVTSLTLGTFGALYQKKIKRLLAYSSITGIGYFLLLFIYENPIMLQNIYTYILLYSFSLLSIFTLFLQLFLSKDKKYIEQISSLKGLININRGIAIILLFFIFNIAGIPPFSLFIGKLLLLTALAISKNYFFIFITIIITILSCYYYLKLIKIVYFDVSDSKWLLIKNLNYTTSFLLIIFAFLQLYFFLNPSIIFFVKYIVFSI